MGNSLLKSLSLAAVGNLLFGMFAHALDNCPFPDLKVVPSDFVRLDSIEVRLPGEAEFHAPNPGLCGVVYAPTGESKSTSILTYINLSSNTGLNFELAPQYPKGTELKLGYSFKRDKLRWGSVIAGAENIKAEYGDEIGGNPDSLSVIVKTHSEYLPSTPDITRECESKMFLIESWAYVVVNFRDMSIDERSQAGENRVLIATRTRGTSYPQFSLNEKGGITYDQTLRICPQQSGGTDAFADAFFPNITLGMSGLTKSLMNGLPEEVISSMFTAAAYPGMSIRGFTARYSYGERTNLAGVPSSTTPTGLIFRLESTNAGFGYGIASTSVRAAGDLSPSGGVSALAEARAFSLKRSAKSAINKCRTGTGRKSKLRKKYSFKLRGDKVVCAKKR